MFLLFLNHRASLFMFQAKQSVRNVQKYHQSYSNINQQEKGYGMQMHVCFSVVNNSNRLLPM